ncbi:MAG: DEAD/DEAH box helicase, partial [Pirellulaceae bacterium]|nr:DEAD/DEAH box helicase [Pirellulaceae bacterium]
MEVQLQSSIFSSHWQSPLEVGTYATGWQGMLSRTAQPEVLSQTPGKLDIAVVPIKLQAPLPKTIGFSFPESPNFALPDAKPYQPPTNDLSKTSPTGAAPTANIGQGSSTSADSATPPRVGLDPARRTRIAPPKDLIKLEDRLYFVLQPPLETMVASAQLSFPFPPFPYQLEGIAFLFPRETAILADEMGLGKTMQAITTVRMLLLAGQLRTVLLICPKPLVTNWVREFRQWAPEIPVVVVEGDQAKRQWMWQKGAAPVRIANYELMMRDRDAVDNPDQHFDLVILDEAQRIKNRNGTTAEIVRSIPRSRSWALTGTPIENSVEDLVNIFEFLQPGYLRRDMHLKSISAATRDHILRRTKDKVLTEMPPKMFRDEQLELTAPQQDSYRIAEEEGVVQLNRMGESVTIQHVFELVLRLKQICNFDPATGASCKMERLEADMEEIAASGQKAIVFSQWVETLETIRETLKRFGPLEYHGRIPSAKRDGVIQQFKTDSSKHVILMSYGAGSVGLNL